MTHIDYTHRSKTQDTNLEGPMARKILMKKGRTRIRWVAQLMVPGRREWDVPLLRTVLFPHEVQDVLKVRLSDRAQDDHIAWFYEKTGVFSVKSAYHLAMSLGCLNLDQPGCSARADGSRPVFKCIWSANVPPKVRVEDRSGRAGDTNKPEVQRLGTGNDMSNLWIRI
jgi:hypothetical protein